MIPIYSFHTKRWGSLKFINVNTENPVPSRSRLLALILIVSNAASNARRVNQAKSNIVLEPHCDATEKHVVHVVCKTLATEFISPYFFDVKAIHHTQKVKNQEEKHSKKSNECWLQTG